MSDATLQELEKKRDDLTAAKQQVQRELEALNATLAVRQPEMKFKLLGRQRHTLVVRLGKVELELAEVKRAIKELRPQFTLDDRSFFAKAVRDVRDKYQDVAAGEFDHGPSERTLAAQFVRDLNPIVQKLVHP